MPLTIEQRRQYARDYYRKNREEVLRKKHERDALPEIQEYQKSYKQLPEVKERNRLLAVQRRKDPEYLKREREIDKNTKARRREKVNAIQLYYGCMNKNCKWNGDYESYQLDFHHLNPEVKDGQVSLMLGCRPSKLAQEINKCICLCKMCHAEVHYGNLVLDESMLCIVNDDLSIDEVTK